MAHAFTTTIRRAGEQWSLTCTCGWAGRTSLRTKAPNADPAWCRQHLEEAHGATMESVVRRRRVPGPTTLSGIDERLLDQHERARYRALVNAAPDAAENRMPLRAGRTSYFVSLVWAAAVVLVLLALLEADKAPEPTPDEPLAVLLLVVLVGGTGGVVAALVADVRSWRRRRVEDYLDSIRYGERVSRDDVRYREGKAYRLVSDGTDGDGFVDKWGRYHETHWWTRYRRIEVAYEDVPPADSDWDDRPGSPWYHALPWDHRDRGRG